MEQTMWYFWRITYQIVLDSPYLSLFVVWPTQTQTGPDCQVSTLDKKQCHARIFWTETLEWEPPADLWFVAIVVADVCAALRHHPYSHCLRGPEGQVLREITCPTSMSFKSKNIYFTTLYSFANSVQVFSCRTRWCLIRQSKPQGAACFQN